MTQQEWDKMSDEEKAKWQFNKQDQWEAYRGSQNIRAVDKSKTGELKTEGERK